MGGTDFPMTSACTLQGSSVTQGNPVTFTTKIFAVCVFRSRSPQGLLLISRVSKAEKTCVCNLENR